MPTGDWSQPADSAHRCQTGPNGAFMRSKTNDFLLKRLLLSKLTYFVYSYTYCACVWVCMWLCVSVRMFVCAYVYLNVRVSMCFVSVFYECVVCVCFILSLYLSVSDDAHRVGYAWVCVCVCVRACVCVRVCLCVIVIQYDILESFEGCAGSSPPKISHCNNSLQMYKIWQNSLESENNLKFLPVNVLWYRNILHTYVLRVHGWIRYSRLLSNACSVGGVLFDCLGRRPHDTSSVRARE